MRELSDKRLPISAIIPMLNCAHRLDEHLQRGMEWLEFVEEIIIVDSYSTDGSLELAESKLGHLPIKVMQHPKGLYESWNYGVLNASCPYVYFSTVGDSISYLGLRQLLVDAERYATDVVVSPPHFEYEDCAGKVDSVDCTWPVHDLVTVLGIEETRIMEPSHLYNYAIIYGECAILGSSASNLYRRETLIRYPFSDDYQSAGDSAWLIHNNFDVKLAICPHVCSTFLFHSKDWIYSGSEREKGRRLRLRLTLEAICISISNVDGLEARVAEQITSLAEAGLGQGRVDIPRLAELCGYLKSLCNDQGRRKDVYIFIMQRLLYLKRRELDRRYRSKYGVFRYFFPGTYTRRVQRKKTKLEQLVDALRCLPNSMSGVSHT